MLRTFCGMLAYTGCRISEALELTADRVDLKDGMIVLESLKKRQKGVCRPVPAPPVFLDTLNMSAPCRNAATGERAFTCGHGAEPPHGGISAM